MIPIFSSLTRWLNGCDSRGAPRNRWSCGVIWLSAAINPVLPILRMPSDLSEPRRGIEVYHRRRGIRVERASLILKIREQVTADGSLLLEAVGSSAQAQFALSTGRTNA